MANIHCNIPNSQISEEEFATIEQRMYPGKSSDSGFLQQGEKLEEVMEVDQKYLQSVSITYEQIADRLETIVGKYYRCQYLHSQKNLDDVDSPAHMVEEKYMIGHWTYNGAQTCPFQNEELDKAYHGFDYGDTDITIRNINTGRSIVFNTLLLHMIRQHNFFESPKSSHRLEPGQVIELLEIKPNVDYKPAYKYYQRWNMLSGHSENPDQDAVNALSKFALKIYQINDNTIGMLFPSEEYIYATGQLDNIKDIYALGAKHNLSWSATRKIVLTALNEFFDKNNLKQYVKTDDKIAKKIKSECELIEEFKYTGDVNKLYLYVFSKKTKQIVFTVDNITGSLYGGSVICKAHEYKYVPISAND